MGRRQLELVTFADESASYLSSIELDTRRVASVAHSEHRTLRHASGVEPDLQFTSLTDETVHQIEIATPIPGPLASPNAPAAGVLTVSKLQHDAARPADYSAYDHALLRNAALRLALLRASTNNETAAGMFNTLTSSITALGSESHTSTNGASPAQAGTTSIDDERSERRICVPDDLLEALPTIRKGLRDILELTDSHSACFRVALPDVDAGQQHGLSLVRVAAYPVERLQDPKRIQRESDGGVNWAVVRTGSTTYLPVVGDDSRFLRLREETESAISVPVAVEGRVIGVINLESVVPHAYDARLETARAFAAHIATVIANARLAVSRQLQEHATEIIARAHEIADDCKALRGLELKATVLEETSALADAIEVKARGLRTFVAPGDAERSKALPQLLAEALRRAGLKRYELERANDAVWESYGSEAAYAIRRCLTNVIANVKRHAALDSKPRIKLTSLTWAGRDYDVVEFRNVSRSWMTPERAVNLYRVPMPRGIGDESLLESNGDEPGTLIPTFGAYLAGAQARQLGGDVYLAVRDGKHVRITAVFPRCASDKGTKADDDA